MKTKIILVLLIFYTSQIQASSESGPGNGGDGIVRIENGKTRVYLLDLVEAGVEKIPVFNWTIKVQPQIEERIDLALNRFKMKERELRNLKKHLTQKLSELYKQSPLGAFYILRAIELYQWNFVNSELLDVKDEDSVLSFGSEELVQLAIRRDLIIRVNKSLWKKMTLAHQVALILHEALYAVISPKSDEFYKQIQNGSKTVYQLFRKLRQENKEVRAIIGFLFSSDFQPNDPKALDKFTVSEVSSLDAWLDGDFVVIMPRISFSCDSDNGNLSACSYGDPLDWIKNAIFIDDLGDQAEKSVKNICALYSRDHSSLPSVLIKWNVIVKQFKLTPLATSPQMPFDETNPNATYLGNESVFGSELPTKYETVQLGHLSRKEDGISDPKVCFEKINTIVKDNIKRFDWYLEELKKY